MSTQTSTQPGGASGASILGVANFNKVSASPEALSAKDLLFILEVLTKLLQETYELQRKSAEMQGKSSLYLGELTGKATEKESDSIKAQAWGQLGGGIATVGVAGAGGVTAMKSKSNAVKAAEAEAQPARENIAARQEHLAEAEKQRVGFEGDDKLFVNENMQDLKSHKLTEKLEYDHKMAVALKLDKAINRKDATAQRDIDAYKSDLKTAEKTVEEDTAIKRSAVEKKHDGIMQMLMSMLGVITQFSNGGAGLAASSAKADQADAQKGASFANYNNEMLQRIYQALEKLGDDGKQRVAAALQVFEALSRSNAV